MDFIKQANTVLQRFNFADSILKTRLFQSYCLSFFGGALWHLSSSKLKLLTSLTTIFCVKFGHSLVSHTAIVHLVAELESVYNKLYYRYLKFACKTLVLNNDSMLV